MWWRGGASDLWPVHSVKVITCSDFDSRWWDHTCFLCGCCYDHLLWCLVLMVALALHSSDHCSVLRWCICACLAHFYPVAHFSWGRQRRPKQRLPVSSPNQRLCLQARLVTLPLCCAEHFVNPVVNRVWLQLCMKIVVTVGVWLSDNENHGYCQCLIVK